MSPTLSELSNTFESFAVEALGEVIGQLVSSGNFEHLNIAVANMVSKQVLLDKEVLGPVGNVLLGSKEKGSIVVFENTATDG